jgi:hypothetical protein
VHHSNSRSRRVRAQSTETILDRGAGDLINKARQKNNEIRERDRRSLELCGAVGRGRLTAVRECSLRSRSRRRRCDISVHLIRVGTDAARFPRTNSAGCTRRGDHLLKSHRVRQRALSGTLHQSHHEVLLMQKGNVVTETFDRTGTGSRLGATFEASAMRRSVVLALKAERINWTSEVTESASRARLARPQSRCDERSIDVVVFGSDS